jgi:hypothetical protein
MWISVEWKSGKEELKKRKDKILRGDLMLRLWGFWESAELL